MAHYAERHYAECHLAQCYYVGCCSAVQKSICTFENIEKFLTFMAAIISVLFIIF